MLNEDVTDYPNIVYYNDDHSNTEKCTVELIEKLSVSYTATSTWTGLIEQLETGAEFLAVHVDTIVKSVDSSVYKFVDSIKVMSRFIPQVNNLKIAVIIRPTTTQQTIRELQSAGVQGILLDYRSYAIEEVAAAANAHVNSIPYWPKSIIEQLPNSFKLKNIFFREDVDPYITQINWQEFKDAVGMTVITCSNWDQFSHAMLQQPTQITLHVDTLKHVSATIPEIISSIETKLKLSKLPIPIAVAIDPTTTVKTMRELRRAGITGIIPSMAGWGLTECVAGLHAIRDGRTYWPKHIIDSLPGTVKKKYSTGQVVLTGRQEQVFKYITERGSSNKIIARELGISESTVKLHVTEIFKKYGVRSRTQLAVFSHIS